MWPLETIRMFHAAYRPLFSHLWSTQMTFVRTQKKYCFSEKMSKIDDKQPKLSLMNQADTIHC